MADRLNWGHVSMGVHAKMRYQSHLLTGYDTGRGVVGVTSSFRVGKWLLMFGLSERGCFVLGSVCEHEIIIPLGDWIWIWHRVRRGSRC